MTLKRKQDTIEPEKLRALMRMKPTLKDTAAYFDCSEDVIERYIKANWGMRFAEFREQNMVFTRFDLIRTAIDKAKKGDNVMLIFCLKNLCGWRDKLPEEETQSDPYAKMSTQELIILVKEKLQIEGPK